MKHGNLLCDWVGEVHQNKWLAPDCQFPEFLPIPFSVPNMCKHAARIGEIINNQAKGTCTQPTHTLGRHTLRPSVQSNSPSLSRFILLFAAARRSPHSFPSSNSPPRHSFVSTLSQFSFFLAITLRSCLSNTRWPLGPCARLFSLL
jgi:hypothetical protein